MQRMVATEVASTLANQTSENVLCSLPCGPADANNDSPAASFEMRHSLRHKPGLSPDTRLEIRVINSALAGKTGRNPRLQLSMEIEATLVRTCDGQELCIWPIEYRSSPRRLSDWASQDASSLRGELIQCCHEVSEAVVRAVVSGGFVAPKSSHSPTVAAN